MERGCMYWDRLHVSLAEVSGCTDRGFLVEYIYVYGKRLYDSCSRFSRD